MMKLIVLALCASMAAAGVVTPVTPCGGGGTPVQLRVAGCEGAPPCDIAPNTDTLVEGDFIPSQNSADAHFRLEAITSSGAVLPVTDASLGALTGGQLYSAGQTIRISTALSGQTVTVKLDVYDVASNRVEICVQAPMRVL